MFCSQCGKMINDDSSFCGYCGNPIQSANGQAAQKAENHPVQASAPSPAPAPSPASSPSPNKASHVPSFASSSTPQTPTPPSHNKQQVNDLFSSAQPHVGIPQTAAAIPQSQAPSDPTEKAKKIKPAIIGVIALIIIIVIVITGVLTNWFGLAKAPIKDSVNDYSWGELSNISSQISDADDEYDAISIAKKYHLVNDDEKLDGSQVKDLTLSDGTVAQVQIAGIYHDDLADGSGKAGLTFIFKNGLTNHTVNSSNTNSGGWEKSQVRTWLADEGIAMLPADLQNQIKNVKKKTNNTGKTESTSSVTTTSDKLWLFSPVELFGITDFYKDGDAYCNAILNAEGEKYKLFRDSNTAMGKNNNILAKQFNNTVCAWWTRSPLPILQDRFCGVNQDGLNANAPADDTYTVCPGFAL